MLDDLDGFMVDGAVTESVEILFARSRVVAMDRVGHFVEVEAHEHRTKAEAMVTVEVADEDSVDAWRSDVCKDELALGSFTGVEEKAFSIPAEEVGAVIAGAGWLLRRAA